MNKRIFIYLVAVGALLLTSGWWPYYIQLHTSIIPGAPAYEIDVPKQLIQILISGALLCPALYVILAFKYGPKDKHLAYGIIGTLVGFWFK